MAKTGQEVFNLAMDLMSERSANGVISPSSTAEYSARSIGIINNILHELQPLTDVYKTVILTDFSSATGFGEYNKITLPSDFYSLVSIEEYPSTNERVFKFEGYNDLYVLSNYTGSIKLVYKAIPNVITILADTLDINDVLAMTVVAYGLVARLVADENGKLANLYLSLYTEEKNNLRRKSTARIVKRPVRS